MSNSDASQSASIDRVRKGPVSNLPCGDCKNLFMTPWQTPEHKYGRLSSTVWKRRWHDFVVSATLGCPLCWWLLYGYCSKQTVGWTQNGHDFVPQTIDFDLLLRKSVFGGGDLYARIVGKCHPNGPLRIFDIHFFTTEIDPAAREIKARVPLPVRSESLLEAARHWIERSYSSHKAISSHKPVAGSPWPTLLIDISSEQPRLHAPPASERNHYAALSYCWGAQGQLQTTRSALNAFKKAIPSHELSQTIQDAIEYCRLLQIDYLWVDALCIVQDSGMEKGNEIAKMTGIYRNAYVTISAASAASAAEGFLGQGGVWCCENIPPIYLPWRNKDGVLGSVGLYPRFLGVELAATDPINDRAWTLQESLLSARILIFSNHNVYFADASFYDCLPRGLVGPKASPASYKSNRQPLGFGLPTASRTWKDILEEYCKRQSSEECDKLTAIGGIANIYGSSTDYLAGLWKNSMPYTLLWRSVEHTPLRRPSIWRAPTWSWAAVEGPVQIHNGSSELDHRSQAVDIRPKLMKYRIVPVNDRAPFGQLMEASLTLAGYLIESILDTRRMRLHIPEGVSPGCSSNFATAYLDTVDDLRMSMPGEANDRIGDIKVTCLCVSYGTAIHERATTTKGSFMCGLILRNVDLAGCYERIGTFQTLTAFHPPFGNPPLSPSEGHWYPLDEYELPADGDSSHLIDPTESFSGQSPPVRHKHKDVPCNGTLCTQDITGIEGVRYWCVGCAASYCERCKIDSMNHPNRRYSYDKQNPYRNKLERHRYLRLPRPVQRSLITDYDLLEQSDRVMSVESSRFWQTFTLI